MQAFIHIKKSLLRKLVIWGTATYRLPSDAKHYGDTRDVQGKLLAFGLALTLIAMVFGPTLLKTAKKWDNLSPDIIIPPEDFKVVFDSSAPCPEVTTLAKDCLAHPKNPKLWMAKDHINSPDHTRRVRERRGQTYWIGVKVPSDTVARAAAQGFNHFLLRQINADYAIWLNGNLMTRGLGDKRKTQSIAIPFDLMKSGNPLYIAIEIDHNRGSDYPDVFNMGRGEGFTNLSQIESIEQYWSLRGVAQNLSIAAVEFVFAVIFLYFWLSATRKPEYFYVALLSLVYLATHLLLLDYVKFSMNRDLWYSLDVCLRSYEGLALLTLGLAFGRSQQSIQNTTLIAGLILPLFFLLGRSENASILVVSAFVSRWWVPLACVVGGGYCGLQALALHEKASTGTIGRRIARLYIFTTILSILGVMYFVQATNIAHAYTSIFAYRFSQLGLVSIMASIVLLDYKEMERLSHHIPFSRFHLQNPLPNKISGWFLRLDVKGSRRFVSEFGEGAYHELLGDWIQRLTQCAALVEGEQIFTSGDEVAFFFEAEENGLSLEKVLECLASMVREQVLISRQYQLNELLSIRASLTYDYLVPQFVEMGQGRQRPDFKGDVLIYSASLLEVEKRACQNHLFTTEHSSHLIYLKKDLSLPTSYDSLIAFKDIALTDFKEAKFNVSGLDLNKLVTSTITGMGRRHLSHGRKSNTTSISNSS